MLALAHEKWRGVVVSRVLFWDLGVRRLRVSRPTLFKRTLEPEKKIEYASSLQLDSS